MFILKSIGISDSVLGLLEILLTELSLRVLINGQTFEWLSVKAG